MIRCAPPFAHLSYDLDTSTLWIVEGARMPRRMETDSWHVFNVLSHLGQEFLDWLPDN